MAQLSRLQAVPTRTVLGAFDPAGSDPLHDLVRAARRGEPAALRFVIHELRLAIPRMWPSIDGVVVPVPGHLPGDPNQLVLTAARQVAEQRRWSFVDDALVRRLPAPEGKRATTRDVTAESDTLAWNPVQRGGTVVLVDDVVRTGATLAACVDAVRRAGDVRPIVAIVLAAAVR